MICTMSVPVYDDSWTLHLRQKSHTELRGTLFNRRYLHLRGATDRQLVSFFNTLQIASEGTNRVFLLHYYSSLTLICLLTVTD